jgi:gas vesicle protein
VVTLVLSIIKLIVVIIINVIALIKKISDRKAMEVDRDMRRLKELKPARSFSENDDVGYLTYEKEEDMANSNTGTVILAFVAGGVVGAALGVLFAPKSGKETREDIKGAVDDIKTKTDELTQEAKVKIEGFVEEAKHKLSGDKEDEVPEAEEA